MKMRKKALIAITALTIGIFITFYAIANLIVLRSFTMLEEQKTEEVAIRTANALSNELSELDGKTADWAFWDDTYQFVQDANENYVALNLADSTFTNLRLNLMVFVDSSGQIVYSKAFDLRNRVETPVPQSMIDQIVHHSVLWNHSDTDSKVIGTVLLPEEPVLIASKPILTSQEEGPINGALIFGRYVDSKEIEYLSDTVNLDLTVNTYNDPDVPDDFERARSSLSNNNQVFVQPLDADSVAGYVLLRDIFGNPAFVLRVDCFRDIYQQGLLTVNYFMFAVLATCLIFGATIMIILEQGVLSPLSKLTTSVKGMGKSQNDAAPVSRLGTDEMSILSQAIKDAVSQRLAAIEELAGMIGHDLRNPLTGIAGATYYLKTRYAQAMDAKGKEMLKIIDDDIVYSNKIIDDLLEYSKKVKLNATETDPKSLIKEASSLVTIPEIIQLTDLTQTEPKLTVDADKLKRAFTNIMKNAVDAMPQGGTLTITSQGMGQNVEFTFEDTGIGMSKETLEKLWMPLFTTKAKGMGFGLPITKRFIEAHGGSIFITSTVGKGTKVTVAIPSKARAEKDLEIWMETQEPILASTQSDGKPYSEGIS